jgi:hypothetical protein
MSEEHSIVACYYPTRFSRASTLVVYSAPLGPSVPSWGFRHIH